MGVGVRIGACERLRIKDESQGFKMVISYFQ